MSDYILPLLAVVGWGLALYQYNKTKTLDSGTTPTEPVTPTVDLSVIRQFADQDDVWSDPHTLKSNKDYIPKVSEEVGQFGLIRNIYIGQGESEFTTYGDNFQSL